MAGGLTHDQIIDMAVNDPLVIQQNTKTGAGGAPIPPSGTELKSRANRWLTVLLSGMYNDQAIARAISKGTYTLTLDGTSDAQSLPDYVQRVVNVRASEAAEPISLFAYEAEYDTWRSQYYPTGEGSSGSDPVCALWSRSATTGECTLQFPLGSGSASSVLVRYIRRPTAPLSVDSFPQEGQPYFAVALVNRLAGVKNSEDEQAELNNLKAAIGLPVTAKSRPSYPGSIGWKVRTINANVVGHSSQYSGSRYGLLP